jgi:hypothetical protein
MAGELPDEAVVVRGGFMGIKSLIRSAYRHFDDPRTPDEFAWSFWSGPGKTADEIARDATFENDHIRESTVGRMRAAGFYPEQDSTRSDHVKVTLPGPPTSDDCERLRSCFGEARPRPTR